MKHFRVVLIIGIVEILIGGATLLGVMASLAAGTNAKPPNVLFFVTTAAGISTLLGIGILRFKRLAYRLLLYFASVVLLSKLLIFLNVIHLNGALETAVPAVLKNTISIVYHGGVIYYLKQRRIRKIFHVWP